MKGTFFRRPLEYHLYADGEEWEQGSTVAGHLLVRNSGSESIHLETLQIALTYGILKLIKAKEPDAWELLQTLSVAEDVTLAPQEEQKYSWALNLSSDCPISDKSGSLFLRYGDTNVMEQGKIDIRVQLSTFIRSFLQTFETQFRFVKKLAKFNKGFTEVKMVPPDSKQYPTLDYVTCLIRMDGENLEIIYKFKMKKFGKDEGMERVKVVNKRLECHQIFTPEQYSAGGFPNRDCFRQAIQQAIDEARPAGLF